MAGERNQDAAMVTIREPTNISLQCPKLTMTNYTTWAIMVESILQANGLWDAVDPAIATPVEARRNATARAFIFQSLPEDILLQVATHTDAREVWNSIKTRFLGVDRVQKARLQTLRSELEKLQMGDSETVDDFAGKISSITAKFKGLGSTIEEEVIVRKLLSSMPPKFMQIVAAIEQFVDLESMLFEEAVGRLKAFEERIKGAEGSSVDQTKLLLTRTDDRGKQASNGERYAGRGRGSKFRGRGRGRGRSGDRERGGHQPSNDNREPDHENNDGRRDRRNIQCYNCNKIGHYAVECRTIRCYNCDKLGHYAEECWNPKRPVETKEETHLAQEDGPALLMARCSESVLLNERSVCPRTYTKDEDDESIWYLDNGASNHMTGNLKHFNELDEKIVGKVRFGDDSTIDIKGKGSVLLQCKNGEQRLITNVYYIPHLSSNILSLGQFTEGGCRVVMQDNVLKMYETSDKLLLKVERTLNRLYKIKLQTVPPKCLPNKMDGKIMSDEVANYDLIPAASHELNMSHMEGQNDGQRTASSSSENQPIATSVSRVLEAGNQPKNAYFGAAGAAPENNITSSNFTANKEQSIGKVAEQAKVEIVRDCLDIRERTKEANDMHDEEANGVLVDFFTKRLSRVKMRELFKEKKLKDVKFGIKGVNVGLIPKIKER